MYDAIFPDDSIQQYAANIIAENMYSQVDANDHSHTLLDSIIDYDKTSNAVDIEDIHVTTKSGQRKIKKSTQGWNLLILWKDGSEQCVPLNIMKESHPVEVAEFAHLSAAATFILEAQFCQV